MMMRVIYCSLRCKEKCKERCKDDDESDLLFIEMQEEM